MDKNTIIPSQKIEHLNKFDFFLEHIEEQNQDYAKLTNDIQEALENLKTIPSFVPKQNIQQDLENFDFSSNKKLDSLFICLSAPVFSHFLQILKNPEKFPKITNEEDLKKLINTEFSNLFLEKGWKQDTFNLLTKSRSIDNKESSIGKIKTEIQGFWQFFISACISHFAQFIIEEKKSNKLDANISEEIVTQQVANEFLEKQIKNPENKKSTSELWGNMQNYLGKTSGFVGNLKNEMVEKWQESPKLRNSMLTGGIIAGGASLAILTGWIVWTTTKKVFNREWPLKKVITVLGALATTGFSAKALSNVFDLDPTKKLEELQKSTEETLKKTQAELADISQSTSDSVNEEIEKTIEPITNKLKTLQENITQNIQSTNNDSDTLNKAPEKIKSDLEILNEEVNTATDLLGNATKQVRTIIQNENNQDDQTDQTNKLDISKKEFPENMKILQQNFKKKRTEILDFSLLDIAKQSFIVDIEFPDWVHTDSEIIFSRLFPTEQDYKDFQKKEPTNEFVPNILKLYAQNLKISKQDYQPVINYLDLVSKGDDNINNLFLKSNLEYVESMSWGLLKNSASLLTFGFGAGQGFVIKLWQSSLESITNTYNYLNSDSIFNLKGALAMKSHITTAGIAHLLFP